jgi:hypothetical protein
MSIKSTIERAIKHGFDLSTIPFYNPKKFREGLYEYLVNEKYFVFEEEEVIIVGCDITIDLIEIHVTGTSMKVVPLAETGFFEILINIFKYITIAAKEKKEEDISTESITPENSESSEELWL